jgi:hypothetical protein
MKAEQIVRKLREAERLLAQGADVDSVCRHRERSFSEVTTDLWPSRIFIL